MRRRAVALLIATLTAGALVVGFAGEASASVKGAKAPLCAGKTKKAAYKAIKLAYDHFLNGKKFPTDADKEAYIQYLSPPHKSALLVTQFEASAAKNASSAATTSVVVHTVKCSGKKKAVVTYDLVLGGKVSPGIAPNPDGAILEGSIWKVDGTTLCNLEGVGDPTLVASGPCADIVAGKKPSDVT
jgi:hypothetical protein